MNLKNLEKLLLNITDLNNFFKKMLVKYTLSNFTNTFPICLHKKDIYFCSYFPKYVYDNLLEEDYIIYDKNYNKYETNGDILTISNSGITFTYEKEILKGALDFSEDNSKFIINGEKLFFNFDNFQIEINPERFKLQIENVIKDIGNVLIKNESNFIYYKPNQLKTKLFKGKNFSLLGNIIEIGKIYDGEDIFEYDYCIFCKKYFTQLIEICFENSKFVKSNDEDEILDFINKFCVIRDNIGFKNDLILRFVIESLKKNFMKTFKIIQSNYKISYILEELNNF